MIGSTVSREEIQLWLIYTDGSHGRLGSGMCCLILTLTGKQIEEGVQFGFKASNNNIEYEATIYILKTTKAYQIAYRLKTFSKSFRCFV